MKKTRQKWSHVVCAGTLLAGEHIKMLWFLQEPEVKRKGQQWETPFQTDFQKPRLHHPQNLEFSTLSASASRQEKKDHVGDCAPSCPYHPMVISNYTRTWEVRVSLSAQEEKGNLFGQQWANLCHKGKGKHGKDPDKTMYKWKSVWEI